MNIKIKYPIFIILLFTTNCFAQYYKGKGDSKGASYICNLKINADSTILFNYFDDRGNYVFADFKGKIKKVKDSVYQINCDLVFGQYFMRNFYPDQLTLVIDSGAQNLFELNNIKVTYKNGKDTTFKIKYIKRSIYSKAFGTAIHKIYKPNDNSKVIIDIGYKDIMFNKKVLFTLYKSSALNFVASFSESFQIKITGDSIFTIGDPILQTGHLKMKKSN
jgi:hypothetical protein